MNGDLTTKLRGDTCTNIYRIIIIIHASIRSVFANRDACFLVNKIFEILWQCQLGRISYSADTPALAAVSDDESEVRTQLQIGKDMLIMLSGAERKRRAFPTNNTAVGHGVVNFIAVN